MDRGNRCIDCLIHLDSQGWNVDLATSSKKKGIASLVLKKIHSCSGAAAEGKETGAGPAALPRSHPGRLPPGAPQRGGGQAALQASKERELIGFFSLKL